MFSKFRTNQNKYPNNKPPATYSQKLKFRSRIKQLSYSQMHINKKTVPGESLDFHVVSNDSYVFQGQWIGSYKCGEGIAFLKNGTMIIGHWQKDQLNGRALIFTTFGALISANFINNRLNGWVLAEYKNKLIVANLYFQDKVDGPRIIFQGTQQLWMASDFTIDGQLIKITCVEKGKRTNLPLFVQNDELLQIFDQLIIKKNYTYDFQYVKNIPVSKFNNNRYIGFVDKQQLPSGLGITYSQQQIFVGNFQSGFLDQFGRMIFQNGDIYHGGFNNGQFFGHGIYYSFIENKTLVIISTPDQQNQVIEQQKGYYLVDFQSRIGQKIAKEDQINFTEPVKTFMKLLQQYYQQYRIQYKMKQQINFSNQSQDAKNSQRMKDIQQLDQNTYLVKPIKWISGIQKDSGVSEQMQDESYKGEFIKAQMHKKTFQITNQKRYFSPKNQSGNNQFFSVAVKQNQQENEKQKYNKQNPKNIETKNQLFSSQYIELASKSLDVNNLTFRGNSQRASSNNKKQPIQNNKFQQKQFNQIYQDFQQIDRKMNKNFQKFSRKSSQVSEIDKKITGVMKKPPIRRRIFQ